MYIIDMDAHPPFEKMNINYTGDTDNVLFFERLAAAGIDKACGTLIPPDGFFGTYGASEAVRLLNQKSYELSKSEPRYIPMLNVHPDCALFSAAQMKEYAALGVNAVEIDAQWLDRDEIIPILDCADELGMLVKLINENISHVTKLASKYPMLKIMAIGFSCKYTMPEKVHEVLKNHPNVYVSMSADIWVYNYMSHEWCGKIGVSRFLFGTAYPYANPASKLAAVKWELRDQNETAQNNIFYENALKVLSRKE